MVRSCRLIFALLAVALLAGCQTPRVPSDPRDPEIYRPAKPAAYPVPR